jgi:anti-anti-sigma factor
MSVPLQITVRSDAYGPTVALSGELDMLTAPRFADVVLHICLDGPERLRCDITEVTFMDTTGLRSLLAVMALCERQSCAFTLTRPSRQVQRILKLFEVTPGPPFAAVGEPAPESFCHTSAG